MSKAPNIPITPAIRLLRDKGVAFEPALYDYVERGCRQKVITATRSAMSPPWDQGEFGVQRDKEPRPFRVWLHEVGAA